MRRTLLRISLVLGFLPSIAYSHLGHTEEERAANYEEVKSYGYTLPYADMHSSIERNSLPANDGSDKRVFVYHSYLDSMRVTSHRKWVGRGRNRTRERVYSVNPEDGDKFPITGIFGDALGWWEELLQRFSGEVIEADADDGRYDTRTGFFDSTGLPDNHGAVGYMEGLLESRGGTGLGLVGKPMVWLSGHDLHHGDSIHYGLVEPKVSEVRRAPARILAHEVGHNLGLGHPYDNPNGRVPVNTPPVDLSDLTVRTDEDHHLSNYVQSSYHSVMVSLKLPAVVDAFMAGYYWGTNEETVNKLIRNPDMIADRYAYHKEEDLWDQYYRTYFLSVGEGATASVGPKGSDDASVCFAIVPTEATGPVTVSVTATKDVFHLYSLRDAGNDKDLPLRNLTPVRGNTVSLGRGPIWLEHESVQPGEKLLIRAFNLRPRSGRVSVMVAPMREIDNLESKGAATLSLVDVKRRNGRGFTIARVEGFLHRDYTQEDHFADGYRGGEGLQKPEVIRVRVRVAEIDGVATNNKWRKSRRKNRNGFFRSRPLRIRAEHSAVIELEVSKGGTIVYADRFDVMRESQ